ncbi:SRPBCC family protein [Methylomagnum ishizawai]|uniref:SRPBCC family protein n=1 Tax=Methylomagnum ishizawai TaxID=1760988 RepID=UPI001C33F597|nr:SRPBCC family protein [Methylomagnum ishizawai]BBL76165.1 cyclase [Methylomagnum ishizawai]
MANLHQSIEIDVPVQTAYNQWTQFEDFPSFMENIEEVQQLDDQHLHWRASIGGTEREWETEITEQIPDQRIAWRTVSGAENRGVVRFESLGTDRTLLTVDVEYQPGTLTEKIGDMLGMVSSNIEEDLENFKEFIESQGGETGAWRSEIH